MLNKVFEKHAVWGLVFLRLGVGLIFFIHGIGKLFNVGPAALGMSNVAGYLGTLSVPIPVFFAWVVAIVETFGGLFIILGLLTRLSALLIAVDMIVAILLQHLSKGFLAQNGGFEFPLMLLLGAIALLFSGSGKKLSLERKLFKK